VYSQKRQRIRNAALEVVQRRVDGLESSVLQCQMEHGDRVRVGVENGDSGIGHGSRFVHSLAASRRCDDLGELASGVSERVAGAVETEF
jgi:hypothetical protein